MTPVSTTSPVSFGMKSGVQPCIGCGLNAAFGAAGIEDWTPLVKQDPRFMRPAEVDLLIGDSTKARKKLGWAPTVSFQQLVTMMVESDIDEQSRLAGLS